MKGSTKRPTQRRETNEKKTSAWFDGGRLQSGPLSGQSGPLSEVEWGGVGFGGVARLGGGVGCGGCGVWGWAGVGWGGVGWVVGWGGAGWEGSGLMGGCKCHLFSTFCLPFIYLSFTFFTYYSTFFSPSILPFFHLLLLLLFLIRIN